MQSNGGGAPERAESLGGAGPQNELMVEGCDGGSDEWPNPEYPLHKPNPLALSLNFNANLSLVSI